MLCREASDICDHFGSRLKGPSCFLRFLEVLKDGYWIWTFVCAGVPAVPPVGGGDYTVACTLLDLGSWLLGSLFADG